MLCVRAAQLGPSTALDAHFPATSSHMPSSDVHFWRRILAILKLQALPRWQGRSHQDTHHGQPGRAPHQ